MPIKVLAVDDSLFFRNRIRALLKGDDRLTLVGTAANGLEAIECNRVLHPDVILMDYEMPKMNGIEAIKVIMKEKPCPIVMMSAYTKAGSDITTQAMNAGAVDWFSKSSEAGQHFANTPEQITDCLVSVASEQRLPARTQRPITIKTSRNTTRLQRNIEVVVVGSSTGGPLALQTLLNGIPSDFPVPIVIAQHMPGHFTASFAERLNELYELDVCEAQDGMYLKPGRVYLGPGGLQCVIGSHRPFRLSVYKERDTSIPYHPSVDLLFESAAEHVGAAALGIVMTGMGCDGSVGAEKMKAQGANIWTQSEESCVIAGMPNSVVKRGLSDASLSVAQIQEQLLKLVKN